MLPLESEQMPDIKANAILRRTTPFSLLTRIKEIRDGFPREVGLMTMMRGVRDLSDLLPEAAAYSTFTGVICDQLERKGVLNPEQVDQAVRESIKHERRVCVEDLLTLENSVPVLNPRNLVGEVNHLAFAMISVDNTQGLDPVGYILTPWEKMVISGHSGKYPGQLSDGLAFNDIGQVVSVSRLDGAEPNLRWPRTFSYYSVFVANAICRRMQAFIDPGSQQRPEQFIKELVTGAVVLPQASAVAA